MKSSRRSFLLNPLSMLLAGLLLGIAARLFDIYFQNLGEIFSQIAIWILLGTGFAIYSPTKKAAMENIFPFCMGMLAAYYVTAAITHGVYSRTFIIGWAVFALTSPVMAYFAWMANAMPICRSGTLPIGAPGIGRYRHRKGRMRHESSCV